MKCRPNLGKCKLCGKTGVLTFEHVPPKNSFNNNRVKKISLDTIIGSLSNNESNKKLFDLNGKIYQNGVGGYYLCSVCNTNTGSWYVPHYQQFISLVGNLFLKENIKDKEFVKIIASINPLPIFKEIMVMFCDINFNCFGDQNLRDFLLKKNSDIPFDSKKYRVFCYIFKGPITRMNSVMGELSQAPNNTFLPVIISEISCFPLGFALYIDLPDYCRPKGYEITYFSKFDYDDTFNCKIKIPILESHTVMSGDYRTKKEILKNIP